MHHPGPPRFLDAGETTQLAPRDPDPEASYAWRVVSAPPDSEATVGDGAVSPFTPDRPGRYVLGLSAPDGEHRLTVRAFPSAFAGVDVAGGSGEAIREGEATGEPVEADATEPRGSGYPHVADDRTARDGMPRVRLDARIEDDEAVVAARATPHPYDDRDPNDLEVEFLVDDRDVADATAAGRPNPRNACRTRRADDDVVEWRVPLDAVGDRLRVHGAAVARGPERTSHSVADAVSIAREADGEFSVVRLNQPPEWTETARVYEVYVRTFTDAPEGERFAAVTDRIPELDELGVDTLWLTPVLQHDGKPHGYNITDFLDTADDLGSREEYEALVETAHDHGMRVLFDFVANHTARDHPWFEDAYRNPDSAYREHFEWQETGEPGTYFDWELIANLNHDNLQVRRFLLDVVDEWAPLVDGFRCDMAWAVPDSFWRELRDRVKAMDDEFLLLDETIPYIPEFHEGMFDVHFDATLYFRLRQIGRGDEPATAALDAIDERTETGFPDHAGFLQYVENHDETRYRVECGDAAAAAAIAATFTLPGVPMIYAGGEIGQRGRRDPIAWEHAREEVRAHHERLIDAHDAYPALGPAGDLRRVDYRVTNALTDDERGERPLAADGGVHPDDVVAFVRELPEEERGGGDGNHDALLVVLNFAPGEAVVSVDAAHGDRNLLTEEAVTVEETGERALSVESAVIVPLDE
ncbi:hypothetical protein JCM17823_00230 [Halorubrum gandharaense]